MTKYPIMLEIIPLLSQTQIYATYYGHLTLSFSTVPAGCVTCLSKSAAVISPFLVAIFCILCLPLYIVLLILRLFIDVIYITKMYKKKTGGSQNWQMAFTEISKKKHSTAFTVFRLL